MKRFSTMVIVIVVFLALLTVYNNIVNINYPTSGTITTERKSKKGFRTAVTTDQPPSVATPALAGAAGESADYDVDEYVVKEEVEKETVSQETISASCSSSAFMQQTLKRIETLYSSILMHWIHLGAREASTLFESQWGISPLAASHVRARIERAFLLKGKLVFAFTGGSATYGETKYPHTFEQRLAPLFEAVGIELVVTNLAKKRASSFPYGWCLRDTVMQDVDFLSWEFETSVMGLSKNFGLYEAFIRQGAALAARPVILALHLEDPKQWLDQSQPMYAVNEQFTMYDKIGLHHFVPGNGVRSANLHTEPESQMNSPAFWKGASGFIGDRGHSLIGDSLALFYLRQLHITLKSICDHVPVTDKFMKRDNEVISVFTFLMEAYIAKQREAHGPGGYEYYTLPSASPECSTTCAEANQECVFLEHFTRQTPNNTAPGSTLLPSETLATNDTDVVFQEHEAMNASSPVFDWHLWPPANTTDTPAVGWIGTSRSGTFSIRQPTSALKSHVVLCEDVFLKRGHTLDLYSDGDKYDKVRLDAGLNITLNGIPTNFAQDTIDDIVGQKQVSKYGVLLQDAAQTCVLINVHQDHIDAAAKTGYYELGATVAVKGAFVLLERMIMF